LKVSRCSQQLVLTRAISKSEANKRAQGAPTNNVFVGGIPNKTTREELFSHFSTFGKLKDLFLPTSQSSKLKNKGFCFMTFQNVSDAVKAVNTPGGHRIRAKIVS